MSGKGMWKYANVPCGHCGAVTAQRVLDGAAFREARKRAGVSLREVAKMAGISAAYLSDIERGQRLLRPGDVADRLLGVIQ